MKAYGGVDLEMYIFLTSALAGSEWSASRPGRFTRGKEPLVLNGDETHVYMYFGFRGMSPKGEVSH
jgi:hypothetical protein